MRLFPNQISAINQVIERVVQSKKVLDGELKYHIDINKKWGSKDRKNFYQACYDIIRNYELLDYLGKKSEKGVLGAYLDHLADLSTNFEDLDKSEPNLDFNTRYSIGQTALDIYLAENNAAVENIKAMHGVGNIYLRVNTSLIAMDEFEANLRQNQIDYERIDSIKIENREFPLNCIRLFENTSRQREFFDKNANFFEIQDIGSQILTEFVDFSQAKTVIESCAGNGGKTAHILDKTHADKVLIVAMDSEKKKIEHLRQRVSKWKNNKVVTEVAKDKDIMKYDLMADILYMDMPCTGSGTLKRQSDLKYRISKDVIDEKVKTQRQIFSNFNDTLKRGGVLVYSTCSIFHSENEAQVDFIVSSGYELIDSLRLEPKDYAGDGFYVAKLRKL